MNENDVLHILLEEAEDGCYGDFLVERKLYTEAEADAYIKEKAIKIFGIKDIDRSSGIKCCFQAQSQFEYGTGIFRFVEMSRNK